MADARYVIDIILNARDNTSAAFAKATGNAEAFKRITQEQEQQNKRTAESFEQMSRRINTSQAELTRQMKAASQVSGDQLDATVRLEKASRDYVRTLNDAKSSENQRLQSLKNLRNAENDLVKLIEEQNKVLKENERQDARRTAQSVANAAKRSEAARQEQAAFAEAAKARAAAERDAERARAEEVRRGEAQARDIEETEQARHRARIDRANQEAQAERDLAQVRQALLAAENRQAAEEEARRQASFEARQHQLERQAQAEEEAAQRRIALNRILDRSEQEAERRRVQNAERELREIRQIDAQREATSRANAERQKRELSGPRQYIESLQRINSLERERKQAANRGDVLAVAKIDIDAKEARAEAIEVAAGLRSLFDHIEANVDLDAGEATAHAAALLEMKRLLSRDVTFNVDVDAGAAAAKLAAVELQSRRVNSELGFMKGLLSSVSSGFHDSSGTIASFDNFLRGLLSLGIAAFFNQLFLLAGAAAGALFSLASSAAQAGAAVGGALVAGIAQALGPLGLLVAAAARVKSVIDAVQQANLLQQQQSYQGAQQDRARASAIDQVRGAQERLADAQRRVVTAQRDVNRARQEGIDKLRDLVLAERGLMLGVEETREAVRRAAASGDTSALPRAFLARDQAATNLNQTQREVSRRQSFGPGNSPELEKAQESLRDAQRAAREAGRSLDGARRSATQASEGVTAAAGKLDFLLSRMSGAERRLYEAILRLQTVWRDFSQNVTEPLINAFTFAINRVTELLQDPKIIGAARSLSEEMAKQFRRIFSEFTSNEAIGQMLRIVDQARKNLKPLADIVINIGHSFLDLAEAAGPAFAQIIRWVRDISKNIADFFESGRKSGELQGFFKEGVVHLKAWGDLLWQVIRLFAALAGPGGGAQNGLQLVRDMSDAIRGWADAIKDPDSKLNNFFQRFFRLSRQMMEALGPVFEAIAEQFALTFNDRGVKSVQGFVFFLSEVLIPAIGKFARFMGEATIALADFGKQHPNLTRIGSAMIAAALAATVFGRAMAILGPIVGPLKFLVGQFASFTGIAGRAAAQAIVFSETLASIGGVIARLRPILLGPWGAFAAVFVLLLQRAGKLDDIFRAIGNTARRVVRQVRPAFDDFMESVNELIASISEGGGLLSVIRDVFGFFLDVLTAVASVIGDVLISAIIGLGDILAGVGKGVLRVFGGLLDFINAIINLLQGDFDEAGRLALRGVKRIAQGILDALWGVLSGIGGFFVRLFRRAINALLEFLGIHSPSTVFMEIGRQILSGLWEGIKHLPRFLINAFTNGLDRVSEFIHGIGSKLEDFGSRIIKAIARGIVGGATAVADAVGDAVGKATDAIPDVTPWSGLTPFAAGGPIPGPVGKGMPILAHGGEHMFTASEVAQAGGHGVMYAIRRRLGGGGQGGRGGYAAGGRVAGGTPMVGVQFAGNLDGFADAWGAMWQKAAEVAHHASELIQATILRLNNVMSNVMADAFRDFRRRWEQIEENGTAHSRRLVNAVTKSFETLQDVVYKGIRYVARTTNEALKGFDTDPVKLSIDAPRKAGGGIIGNWGERGRDAVAALVGKGEVVLNWGQQQALNARLTGQNTVQSVVEGTKGLHAGTYGDAHGFAGGYAGKIPGNGQAVAIPGAPGEFVAKRIVGSVVQMMRRFKMAVTDGFALTGHAPGGDHPKGLGVDFVPGSGGNWDLVDSAASYARSKLGQIFRWIGYDGVPNHGRGNHLHLSWLSDAQGLGGLALENIKKILVHGSGSLKNLSQRAINTVRGAANRILAAQMDSGFMDNQAHPTGEGILGRGAVLRIIQQAMDIAGVPPHIRAAWSSMAYDRARQESGFNPNAVNNWDSNAAAGDPSRGLFQTIGATFGAYDVPGHGNILNPLDNAIAAFRYMFARYGGGNSWDAALTAMNARRGIGYADGGHIGGPEGSPQFILAHSGEWVLNKGQQSKVAEWLGTTAGALKRRLGFGGGAVRREFQDGGEVTPEQRRLRAIAKGRYELPLVDPDAFEGVEREITRVYRAIANIAAGGKIGKRLNKFFRNISAMTDDGGLLEQMAARLEEVSNRMANALELAQNGFRRVGNRLRRRPGGPLADPVEIADRTVSQYERIDDLLRTNRADARQGLGQVNARLDRLRRGGISKKEQDQYTQLIAAREKFQETLANLDEQFADNQTNLYQARLDRFNARTEARLRGNDRAQSGNDAFSRIADALGNSSLSRQLGESQLGILQERQKILAGRLKRAQELAARDPRFQSVVDDLSQQLTDVSVSIVEQIAENLTNAIEAVQARYENVERGLALRDRIGDLRGRAGDRLGGIRVQQSAAGERVTAALNERRELYGLLATARQQGNQGAVDDLTERIEELNVSIRELQQSQRELTFTYRQTATDIITGRQERSTGLIGTARTILTSLGNLTGNTNFQQIRILIQQTLDQLRTAAGEIADNITASIREFTDPKAGSVLTQLVAAFRSGPGSFASKLAELGPVIAALEATMGDVERSAFQALIQSMIDNTTAVLDNTDQLNQITNPSGQSFSSTLWQMFRIAVFNGNGGLLPQYDLPQMNGYVASSSRISPQAVSTTPGAKSAVGGDTTNLYITSPTEVADPNYIFEVAEFRKSLRRAT